MFDYMHRRHNNPESESAGSDKGQRYSDIHSLVFGVYEELGEVRSGTNSEVGISRHVDLLCNHHSVPSREEVGCHHSEMPVPAFKNSSDDQRGFRTDRHVISQCISSVFSSLALQEVTNDPDRGPLLESQSYNSLITLPQPCREELNWWIHNVRLCNGKSVSNTIADLVVTSDTSKVTWGTSCDKVSTGGFWNKEESKIHINILELAAAEFVL